MQDLYKILIETPEKSTIAEVMKLIKEISSKTGKRDDVIILDSLKEYKMIIEGKIHTH